MKPGQDASSEAGVDGLQELRDLVADVAPGHLPRELEAVVDSALSTCWERLDGARAGGMKPDKLLGRIRQVCWGPPLLSFAIERHGGTKLGSTRAEVQHWTVNLDAGTATLGESGHRQLTPMAPRITAQELQQIASEIADAIAEGRRDHRLRWHGCDTVQVLCTEVFPASFEQTAASRRKRLKPLLEAAVHVLGWQPCGRFRFERRSVWPV